jgi:DNA-binding CsgD family transcriptional regulator/tetratricopeptide (TPR) repeat protein
VVESPEQGGFIGRASELAVLDEALARAVDGIGGGVIVGGEAGIGKTWLVDRFLESARQRGARTLVGACLEFGAGDVPYAPFLEALRLLVRSVEPERLPALLGAGRTELGRLLPELAPRVAQPALPPDRSAPGRLFELVLGLFERLSAEQPLVLVIEDIHWSDASTLDLLAFLVRNLRQTRVLFLVTARTEELHLRPAVLQFLAELDREDQVERIELQPFGRPEVFDQLEALAGERPTAERVDEIMERSGGNPFFVEQLVAAARERDGTIDLPPRLRDVLLARIAAVSPQARELLRAASAAGRRTDDDLLAAVLDQPRRQVTEALRDVIERGILVDADGIDDGIGGYGFRHTLLREVIYGELFSGERLRLHAAFAGRLAERGEIGGVPVSAAELAYHWDAARDYEHALPAIVSAARAAETAYAFAYARRHFERAIELWDPIPNAAEVTGIDRIDLLRHAAEANVLTGSYRRAIELGRAAVDAAQHMPEPDPGRVGGLLERLCWFLYEAGDRVAATAAVEEAIRLIPAEPATGARARALAQAAGMRLLDGQHREAADLATEALTTARAASARSEEALAAGVLGWATAVLGDVDAGIAMFREGLSVADSLGGVEGIAVGYTNLASLLDRVGRTEASLEAASEGYAIAERLGVARTYGGILLGHAGKALINLGRWDEAAAVLDQGLDLDPRGRPAIWLRINQARLDTNRGRYDAAARELGEARAIDGALSEAELYHGALLTGLAELAMWQGRIADVRAAASEGFEPGRDSGPPDPALAWLATIALRAEADAAEVARSTRDAEALAECREWGERIGARLGELEGEVRRARLPATGRTTALALQCRAELNRLDDSTEPGQWKVVAEAWAKIGRPYPAAYARYREAEASIGLRGSRAEAESALRAAYGTAVSLGAEPLRIRIERLAQIARVDLSVIGEDSARAGVAGRAAAETSTADRLGLTDREEEVLRLVAGGWSNQQIADALFISRKTASVHVSNILGKLGAGSRVEAAAIAHRLGLGADAPLPPDSDPAHRPADILRG